MMRLAEAPDHVDAVLAAGRRAGARDRGAGHGFGQGHSRTGALSARENISPLLRQSLAATLTNMLRCDICVTHYMWRRAAGSRAVRAERG